MIEGDKVFAVFDILPQLPLVNAEPYVYVEQVRNLTFVRRIGGGKEVALNDCYKLFDDEAEAHAYAATRLRQHADAILEMAEAEAAKSRKATVVKVG